MGVPAWLQIVLTLLAIFLLSIPTGRYMAQIVMYRKTWFDRFFDPIDNAIYFLTDAETPKDQEIAHNSNVCLAFADPKGQRYVSVTGTAEVFANSAMAERVWRVADKAFFKGADDPRIRVIRVTPDQGEYWEGSGLVASAVSMLIASAKGKRPNLGEGAKVAM